MERYKMEKGVLKARLRPIESRQVLVSVASSTPLERD